MSQSGHAYVCHRGMEWEKTKGEEVFQKTVVGNEGGGVVGRKGLF